MQCAFDKDRDCNDDCTAYCRMIDSGFAECLRGKFTFYAGKD